MGCCSPNYTEHVKEQEKSVNNAGREAMPFWFKVLSALSIISVFYIM